MNTVYLLGPIIGTSKQDMLGWRGEAKERLRSSGYKVLSPLTGEALLWPHKKIDTTAASRYPQGVGRSTWNADRARIKSCDIVLANFLGSKKVSIGSIIELTWAFEWSKLSVLIMSQRNPHRHPWIREVMAGPIFKTLSGGIKYLEAIAVDGIGVDNDEDV